MSQESVQARAIFIDAVENVPPERWREYLDEACGDDATLRDKVQRLLDAHGDIGSFMDKPAAAPVATIDQPITEKSGTQIGPYKLLQQIGEGGMGVVYMAEQSKPVQRRVALKIIKPGMDTQQVIARFEAERQALAIMDHPNVARVLDVGTTEYGRPYFAMELVQGVPITEFCDARRFSTPERIRLFVEVCRAVQHAHQKGIIHRDIKPSNVLVTMHDDRPVPKVIDFGVAKAIGSHLTEKTINTAYGQVVGTPMYMSPEQAQMSGLDVDTRSDVYSLGVLLYELLTGTTPFDKETLRVVEFDEMRRIIREDEPQRPSYRISTLDATAQATVSDRRQMDAGRLRQVLRGELDWIVMKPLEKDRDRRYDSPNALAADLERHLNNDTVSAFPPSVAYRLRKFARKHRVMLGTVVLVSAALIIGVGLSLWQAIEASAARELAATSAQEANDARQRVEENLRLALEALNEITGALGEGAVREDGTIRREAGDRLTSTQLAVLQKSLTFYERFVGQNATEKLVRFETASAYLRIGEIQRVLEQPVSAKLAFRRATRLLEQLVLQNPSDADYRYQLTLALRALEEPNANVRRITLLEHLVREFPDVPEYRFDLGMAARNQGGQPGISKSISALQALVELFPDVPDYRHQLAVSYRTAGETTAAITLLNPLTEQHPNTLIYSISLGRCYEQLDRPADAIALYRELLARQPDNPQHGHLLMNRCFNYGASLFNKGRLDWAEKLQLLSLQTADQLEASGYSDFTCSVGRGQSSLSLSRVLRGQGKDAAADEYLEQATSLFEQLVAIDDDEAWLWMELGSCYRERNKRQQAVYAYRRAAELYEERAEALPSDWNWGKTAFANESLARRFMELRRYEDALATFRKVEQCRNKQGRILAPWIQQSIAWLQNRRAWQLVTSSTAREVIGRAERLAGESVQRSPDNSPYWTTLGIARFRLGRYKPTIAALERSIELGSDLYRFNYIFLAMAHSHLGNQEQADDWYQKVCDASPEDSHLIIEFKRFKKEADRLLGPRSEAQRTRDCEEM